MTSHKDPFSRKPSKSEERRQKELKGTVASRLRALMDKYAIKSAAAFAAEIRSTEPTVNTWLYCRNLPRPENLVDIAKRFDVTVDWLLGVSEDPKKQPYGRTGSEVVADVATEVAHHLNVACPLKLPAWMGTYRWEVSGEQFVRFALESVLGNARAALRDESARQHASKAWGDVYDAYQATRALQRRQKPTKAEAGLIELIQRIFHDSNAVIAFASPDADRQIPLLRAGVRLVRDGDATTREEAIGAHLEDMGWFLARSEDPDPEGIKLYNALAADIGAEPFDKKRLAVTHGLRKPRRRRLEIV